MATPKIYELRLEFDAMHAGGTKFYQIITVTQSQGAARTTGIIAHYGRSSQRKPGRFEGQTKIYGTTRAVIDLAQAKRKSGYTRQLSTCPCSFGQNNKFDDEAAMLKALESMGLHLSMGDRKLMGLTCDFGQMVRDVEEANKPVTEARKNPGILATTVDENPWVGTW